MFLCSHNNLLCRSQSSRWHCLWALEVQREDGYISLLMPSMRAEVLTTNPDIHGRITGLTWQFKSRQKALKEVFARVRHGDGSKLWNCNAVVLLVGLVAVAGQEAAFVNHLTLWYFELVQKSHAIEPVVESCGNGRSRGKQSAGQLIYQPFKDALYSPLVSNLKLSWSISQEISADPFWNFANDVSGNGLWSFIHRSHNLVNARQTVHICKVVNRLFFSSLWLGFLKRCWKNRVTWLEFTFHINKDL